MTFIGQRRIDQYVAIKRDRDAFYGLLNDRGLTYMQTWDILTGKLQSDYELAENLSDYTRYVCGTVDCFSTGLHDHTLLVSKEPVKQDETILAQFFDKSQLTPKFANQKVFFKQHHDDKFFQLHKFKMIEINDYLKVTQHYSFIYPRFESH